MLLKEVFGRNFFTIFRSSSLIVPPPTPQSSTWGSPRSPGSRSLHLSPYHRSKESSPLKTGNTGSAAISTGPEMFTFPSVSDQATIDQKLVLHLCFKKSFYSLQFFNIRVCLQQRCPQSRASFDGEINLIYWTFFRAKCD